MHRHCSPCLMPHLPLPGAGLNLVARLEDPEIGPLYLQSVAEDLISLLGKMPYRAKDP